MSLEFIYVMSFLSIISGVSCFIIKRQISLIFVLLNVIYVVYLFCGFVAINNNLRINVFNDIGVYYFMGLSSIPLMYEIFWNIKKVLKKMSAKPTKQLDEPKSASPVQ